MAFRKFAQGGSRGDSSSAHESYYDGEVEVVGETRSESLFSSLAPSESTTTHSVSSFRTPRSKARSSTSYYDGEVEIVDESPAKRPLSAHDPTEALERLSVEKQRMMASASSSKEGQVAEKTLTPKDKKTAAKVTKLLKDALSIHWNDEEGCDMFATIVQECMLDKYGTPDASYRKKARELTFNIKDPKNTSLVERIVEGAVTPDMLITMPPEELANEQIRAHNADTRWKHIRKATPMKAPTQTLDVPCPRCSKGPAVMRHVNAYDEQVASYLQCVNCEFEHKL